MLRLLGEFERRVDRRFALYRRIALQAGACLNDMKAAVGAAERKPVPSGCETCHDTESARLGSIRTGPARRRSAAPDKLHELTGASA